MTTVFMQLGVLGDEIGLFLWRGGASAEESLKREGRRDHCTFSGGEFFRWAQGTSDKGWIKMCRKTLFFF